MSVTVNPLLVTAVSSGPPRALIMGRKPFRLQRLLSRSFTADRGAPRAARHALDELNGPIDPDVKDDIRLLVSEVVTNSVIHAQPEHPGEVVLDVWASGDVVRVAVRDRGPGFVAAERPQGGERSGWGLMMVDRLAARWGVELEGGTEVWFELQQPGDEAGGATRSGELCLG
ncbi:MAG: ATP-binding protein [Solirubrobacterales bacterium]